MTGKGVNWASIVLGIWRMILGFENELGEKVR
jgi:hypothetical protein